MRRTILRKTTGCGLFYIWIIFGMSFPIGCASTKNEMSTKEAQLIDATTPFKESTEKYSDEHDEFLGRGKGGVGESEEQALQRAILIGTKQALRTFMESHPESENVQEVKDRIQWLEKLRIGIILNGSGRVQEKDKIKAHLCDGFVPLFEKYGERVVFLDNPDESNAQKLSMLVEIRNIYYETNPERGRRVAGAIAGGVIMGGVLGGLIQYKLKKPTFGPPNKTVDYWIVTIKNARLASEYERRKDFQNLDEMFANHSLFSEIRKAETLIWVAEREEPPVGFLRVIFKHADSNFRSEVVKTLAEIRKAPIEFLTDALKDKDSSVRCEAAFALGKVKDTKGVEPLIAALRDENSNVRWRAGKALGDITGQDLGEDPIRWQGWWEKNKGK